MNESLVDTPSGDHVLPLRQSYLELCDGDYPPAILLSILEYWTNHEHRENELRERINEDLAKKGQIDDQYDLNEELWVRRTRSEIVQDSLGFLSKQQVTEAAQVLEEMGLIETGHPFRHEGDNTKHYRLRVDRLNSHMRSVSLTQQDQDRERERMIQAGDEPESPTKGHKWDEDDWQRKYALRWWERMDDLGNGRIHSDWRVNKEKRIQKWADAFDWVVRVRDISRDTLDEILEWLFEKDDFWVPQGAIISPQKFKQKNDQGQFRIQEFLMKANISQEEEKKSEGEELPKPGEEVRGWTRKKLISTTSAAEDDFVSVRYGPDGNEKIYRYDPD
jgi:hypothetical protein